MYRLKSMSVLHDGRLSRDLGPTAGKMLPFYITDLTAGGRFSWAGGGNRLEIGFGLG